jgi:hypothetical protein
LAEPVWFYLRGEEYSAQIDHFVRRVEAGQTAGINGFASAAATDKVIAMMVEDARKGPSTTAARTSAPPLSGRRRLFGYKRR